MTNNIQLTRKYLVPINIKSITISDEIRNFKKNVFVTITDKKGRKEVYF